MWDIFSSFIYFIWGGRGGVNVPNTTFVHANVTCICIEDKTVGSCAYFIFIPVQDIKLILSLQQCLFNTAIDTTLFCFL